MKSEESEVKEVLLNLEDPEIKVLLDIELDQDLEKYISKFLKK